MAKTAFLHPFARPSADQFVNIVRGEGAVVWDDAGTRYVDAMASLWYCQVGHGRPEIADAVAAQMNALEAFHTFEMFTNDPAERLCAALAERSPMPDTRVFLADSGSEAVETALKLSRLYWAWQDQPERRVVISRQRAYHGVGYGGTTLQGLPANQEGWGELLADVVHAETGKPHADAMLEASLALCDEHGALLIFDEVISGFGRLGHWWGAQRYQVTPDLICFAKGATSGYLPLGGVLTSEKVNEVLEADDTRMLRHGFTYSGHPTVCAAALANLAIIEDEGLLERAVRIGDRLGPALGALVDEGLASELRGTDGVWALGLNEGVAPAVVRDHMLANGVIPRPIPAATVAFCPPLVIGDDDLDLIVDTTRRALVALAETRA